MSGNFDALREALLEGKLPKMSIELALKIYRTRQKDGGCNVKANATDSDVKPLIEAGFVRICGNKSLDFTRKAMAILNGKMRIPAPAALQNVWGNHGKVPEKRGRMVHPKGKRSLSRNGH